jgi:hypothetical protein
MRTLKEIPVGTKFMFLDDVNNEKHNSNPPVYIKMPGNKIFYVHYPHVIDSDVVNGLLDDKVVMITA